MSSSFENLLTALDKEHDSKTLLKLLSSVRREVEWPKNKANINEIREKGYLKHFISLLQTQQHKHIIDVCLSILGNCVMDRNCVRDVIGVYNILSALNHILKRFPKEDSINGRVFRILGNLCHYKMDCSQLIITRKPQIITHLKELISSFSESNNKYSEATIIMAIRCLKYLINRCTLKHLMQKFSILNALGMLFIDIGEQWQQTNSNENILNAIINVLHNLSIYKDYDIILELKNTEKGNAMEQLAKVLLLCPKKVIKIIMNLIRISKLKSDLPVQDIFNKFLEQVIDKNIDTDLSKSDCLDYIKCLCYLLDHPVNRNGQQCGKTIPLLIQVLNKLDSHKQDELHYCILLVNTLNKCKFEEALVQEQLNCNILDVLVNKMDWLVADCGVLSKHSFKKGNKRKSNALARRLQFQDGDSDTKVYGKRKASFCEDLSYDYHSYNSPQSPTVSEENYRQRQLSPVSSDDEYNLVKYDRQPSPCSSSSSDFAGLSWASPSSSPRSINNELYSDSDDYSPVCSEADSTEFQAMDLDEAEDDRESEYTDDILLFAETTDENNTNKYKIRLISEIAKLIKCYTKIKPPVVNLGSEKLLLSLLNCSDFYNSKQSTYITTINVMCDILHTHIYLIPLMKSTFIEKIYGLTEFMHSTHCIVCVDHSCVGKMVLKRLTKLAESAPGKGDIAHELLKGSTDDKKQIVITIPYVVEDKNLLAKLLVNCGGLSLLMQQLKEDSVDDRKRIIKVVCVLASKKLQIANPMNVTINMDKLIELKKKDGNQLSNNIVTFKFDHVDECVKTNRNILSEKSDYFCSLLSGHFKESNQDEIRLRNVNFRSFQCLIHLIESNTSNLLDDIDIDTLLDVITLSDRYLMNDVCCFVTNYVEKCKISPKTVPVIYKWSLESGLNLLRVESIAFALVADLIESTRYLMFNQLFDLGYSEQLVQDIHKLLLRYLTSFIK